MCCFCVSFPGFCSELHTECVSAIVAPLVNPDYRVLVKSNLEWNRKLSRGNPNAGNIGEDFNRFNLVFWSMVVAHDSRNTQRRIDLEELNRWRNAIAHNDFSANLLTRGQPVMSLNQVREWRKACNGLALSFDEVMRHHIQSLTGVPPW